MHLPVTSERGLLVWSCTAPGVTTTVSVQPLLRASSSSRLLRLRFPLVSPFTRRGQATRKTARTPLICPLLGHYLYANEKPVKRRDIGLPPPQDGYRDEVETLIRPVALTGDVTHRATVITRTAGVYANSQFYGVSGRKGSKNGSGFVITFSIERSMGDRLDAGCLCKFVFFLNTAERNGMETCYACEILNIVASILLRIFYTNFCTSELYSL